MEREIRVGLVLRWAKAGEKIIIGSREQQKAEDAAKKAREILGSDCKVTAMENSKAAAAADIIVMAVPFAAHIGILKSIRDNVNPAEDVFIDVVVPLSSAVHGNASTALGVWEGSAAQQAAKFLPPNTKVAAAFQSTVAEALHDLSKKVDSDVIVCSDSQETRKTVMDLATKIPGVRAVDGGRLENARIVEQITALLIGINMRYNMKTAGVRITGLP